MSIDPLFPERPQYAVMALLERDTWVVTIGGINGHYPPSDEQGFEQFCRSLQTPLLGEWLNEAEPVSDIRTFRKIEKRWHALESYSHPVARFMAVGDSAWSFNPQYGQGMTIGVGCARILRDVIRKDADLDTLPRRYYPAAKKFAGPPWSSTALLDFAWPGTVGQKPWHTELHRLAGHFFLRSCQFEEDVFRAFIQLLHLLKEPHEVITPKVLFGLARYGLRRMTASLPASSLTALPSDVRAAE
jgi:hypothetical protein